MKNLKFTLSLIATALVITGCQGDDSQKSDPTSQSPEKGSCGSILNAQTKEAMNRIGNIPEATASYRGDPQRTVDWLIGQHMTGKIDPYKDMTFCGAYKGSSGRDSVMVSFSLAQEAPAEGKAASVFTEYRMGKSALASTKKGVLYFECIGGKFGGESGESVLIRGESQNRYSEVTESPDAARKDNLHIVYESSRTLSGMLGCKSNSGLSSSFKMPPEI